MVVSEMIVYFLLEIVFTFHIYFKVLYGSEDKASACNAGDPGLIPGLGRSPGEGNGNPLQYSCLENHMDREAWHPAVHGVQRVGHNLATKLSYL